MRAGPMDLPGGLTAVTGAPARGGTCSHLPGQVGGDARHWAAWSNALEVLPAGGHTLLSTEAQDSLSWDRDAHEGGGRALPA